MKSILARNSKAVDGLTGARAAGRLVGQLFHCLARNWMISWRTFASLLAILAKKRETSVFAWCACSRVASQLKRRSKS